MGLVAVALLIWLDRASLVHSWSEPRGADRQASTADVSRYHGKQFSVSHVIDGDTLLINAPDAENATTKVRLLGIDAPEMHSADAPAMYFAQEATDYAREMAENARVTVYLQEDGPSRGKYDRLLAYVAMPDGRFLNEMLIAEGYAYADLRFRHSYDQKYRQLQAAARSVRIGLWAKVTPEQLPAWLQRMRPDLAGAR